MPNISEAIAPTDDSEPDGMIAYALAIATPSRDDPSWPLPSFDARDWASAFVERAKANPDFATDEGNMIGWFANALMRGFDEQGMRSAPRIERLRVALVNMVDDGDATDRDQAKAALASLDH